MDARRATAPLLALAVAVAAAGCGDGDAERTTTTRAGPSPRVERAETTRTFRSRPDLRPTSVEVTRKRPGTSPGDLFVAPKRSPDGVQAGPMIVDGDGRLVWFRPMSGTTTAYDFRRQRYRGKPVLTWWQGRAHSGYGSGEGVVVDSSYRRIATVRAGNGYDADLHEFLISPQDTALVIAYEPITMDLRSIGGPARRKAIDCVVQELDVRTGRVLMQWRSSQHVAPAESYVTIPKSPEKVFDYVHLNSIDVEPDGNLLVSARGTHALYELDRRSGRILWRMGGKRSDYAMGRGTRTAWQHDARRLPDGDISILDNNAVVKTDGHPTRGVVVHVDERRRRVSLKQDFHYPRYLQAASQANLQMLPGGNAFVGWGGGQRNVSEFAPDGTLLFDARLESRRMDSYRAYRFPWTATPHDPPDVVATAAVPGVRVSASWNGATGVREWRVLAGDRPDRLSSRERHRRLRFETTMEIPGSPRYVAVEALDGDGRVLRRSRTVAVGRRAGG